MPKKKLTLAYIANIWIRNQGLAITTISVTTTTLAQKMHGSNRMTTATTVGNKDTPWASNNAMPQKSFAQLLHRVNYSQA